MKMIQEKGTSNRATRAQEMIPVARWLSELLDRARLSEDIVLLMTATVVGLGAGVGAVVFRWLINTVAWIGYTWFPSLLGEGSRFYVIIVPAVGGALVGLLTYNFAREAKGHGVPEVMEAVALRGGRIRPRVAAVKALASSITIGSGGSAGREGPIVQIGSALGSTLGQIFNLSDDRIRNLVACGAAGGIAATFNAPIAGVIFALEIILREFSARYFSTVVISAVTASVIGRIVFGDFPAFPLPALYQINSIWEYGFYALLGILAALTGVVFVRALYFSEDLFEKITAIPEWVKPAVGGALLGLIAIIYPLVTRVTWDRVPQVFNVGYDVIESALSGQVLIGTVLVLLLLKIVATSLTLGSGGSGGVFAPSLFMGAMLGSAFGLTVNMLFPEIAAPAGAYALVGMAAVFSASALAPISAVIFLFELTGDYRIILPLMLTVVVASLLARRLMRGESIYTIKLSRRGVHLDGGRDTDIIQGVHVQEVMSLDPETVPTSTSLVELSEKFRRSRHRGFPVVDGEGDLWGIVTLQDLERAIEANSPRTTTVEKLATPLPRVVTTTPDESIGDVLIKMGPRDLGRLPVVEAPGSTKLVGLISRVDIVRAYNVALTHRTEVKHRVYRSSGRTSDMGFHNFRIQDGDAAVGRTIQEISTGLPDECIFVSILRYGQTIIPHGETVFLAGDELTVFTHDGHHGAISSCLQSGERVEELPSQEK
jgi:CIC family chloride channel protein